MSMFQQVQEYTASARDPYKVGKPLANGGNYTYRTVLLKDNPGVVQLRFYTCIIKNETQYTIKAELNNNDELALHDGCNPEQQWERRALERFVGIQTTTSVYRGRRFPCLLRSKHIMRPGMVINLKSGDVEYHPWGAAIGVIPPDAKKAITANFKSIEPTLTGLIQMESQEFPHYSPYANFYHRTKSNVIDVISQKACPPNGEASPDKIYDTLSDVANMQCAPYKIHEVAKEIGLIHTVLIICAVIGYTPVNFRDGKTHLGKRLIQQLIKHNSNKAEKFVPYDYDTYIEDRKKKYAKSL